MPSQFVHYHPLLSYPFPAAGPSLWAGGCVEAGAARADAAWADGCTGNGTVEASCAWTGSEDFADST